MSTMTLIQRNGSAEGVNPWLKTTVQQFFQELNWENRPQSQPSASPSAKTSPTAAPVAPVMPAAPDLTASVNQFFGAIAWDGTPTVAAPLPAEEPSAPSPPAEKNVTLDDFFGSF